jgi:predicted hydrolase (HD superfamily)
MTCQETLELLNQNISNQNLIKHCLAMQKAAGQLGL